MKKAFVGATIINGNKKVPILENGTIIVGKDGCIEEIGSGIPLNRSMEVVDVTGKYIMPGLINAHVHLFSNGAAASKSGAGGSMIERENIRDGAEWIKICTTGGVTDSKFVGGTDCTHLNLEETKAIVDEAHRRNIMVASHCESTLGMRDCLEAGVDTIEHASTIMPDMVEKFLHNPKALRGYTAVIPTLLAGGAMHEHPYEDTPANRIIMENSRYVAKGSDNAMKTATENGIAVGVGTDSSVPFCTPYNTYMELVKMQQLTGLDSLGIIDIATRETAMILNIDKETGTLDKGKAADFIVLDKNPLEDLRNIKKPGQVVARGRHYAHPSFKEYPGIE